MTDPRTTIKSPPWLKELNEQVMAEPSFVPQGVEMMRDAGVVTDTTPDALAEVVGICPVFRLDAAN